MIRLPINKSSFSQPVRQKFPTKNHFRISCETILFYKHSQWTTAKTQSRHPIPRDTKETSSGNRKHTLSRDSKAILQFLPQSLVARETTGKDFLMLRHFSLWVVGQDRIDSNSNKYEDHICQQYLWGIWRNLSMNKELLLILMSCSSRALFLRRSCIKETL